MLLASGSEDNTVKLWRPNGDCLQVGGRAGGRAVGQAALSGQQHFHSTSPHLQTSTKSFIPDLRHRPSSTPAASGRSTSQPTPATCLAAAATQ